MWHDLQCFLLGHQFYVGKQKGVMHILCHRCQNPYSYTLSDHIRRLRYRIRDRRKADAETLSD